MNEGVKCYNSSICMPQEYEDIHLFVHTRGVDSAVYKHFAPRIIVK